MQTSFSTLKTQFSSNVSSAASIGPDTKTTPEEQVTTTPTEVLATFQGENFLSKLQTLLLKQKNQKLLQPAKSI